MRHAWWLLLSILIAAPAFADLQLHAGEFDQAVDHSDPVSPRFHQRYWLSDRYAKSAAAPVLYRICGEIGCEHHLEGDGLDEMAEALGARVVYLEHRYYGRSQPFGDLASEHLRFLTLENVLADLAEFEVSISTREGWSGKWIAIGGSYSGSLAAYFRFRHPDLVVGALASSAPMGAETGAEDSRDWDDAIANPRIPDQGYQMMRQWTYQACTDVGYWLASAIGGMLPASSLCERAFGFPKRFDAATFNRLYLEPFVNAGSASASNILFTYGSADIWTRFGIGPAQNHNPLVTIFTIAGAEHHDDLDKDEGPPSAAVREARALFLRMARGWLTGR